MGAPTRSEINKVFATFDKYAPESKLSQTLLKHRPMIFIGHRADPQWRDLRNELHEQEGYEVGEYHIADKGLALRVVADDLVQGCSVAVLVMTADDELPEGKMRARELPEEGTEEFSDPRGVYQIRFAKGRVREAVSGVLDIVKWEFET